MQNYNCIYLEVVTDIRPRQVGENEFIPEQELVDEVCWGRPDSPLHYGSYDCEGCPYFKSVKEESEKILEEYKEAYNKLKNK